jgi:hypothetical protein
MSVSDPDIIDFISTDPKGDVILTISDHLEWDEQLEYLLLLQTKINKYLEFIESDQIYTDYPTAKGKNIIINIYAKFLPNDPAEKFLSMARQLVQSAGFDLRVSFIKNQ